jgi:mRNA interferase RelE/StbE
MRQYRLDFRAGVRNAIDNLPGHLRQRVKRILQELRMQPRPSYAEEMHDELAGCYKINLGAWRLVYEVDDDILIVLVLKVGKKAGSEFYQDMRR